MMTQLSLRGLRAGGLHRSVAHDGAMGDDAVSMEEHPTAVKSAGAATPRTLPTIGSAELRQPALPWSAVPPIGASVATLLTPLPCPPRRSVLKLVSCVQQERGITCGWVAGCGSLDYFGARLDERRAATDAAITKEVALIFPWVSPELVQLRGEVDRAVVHHRHLADGSHATDAADADADAAADAAAADAAAADADAGAAVDADAAGDADEADRREQLKRQLQQRPPLPSTPPSAPAVEARRAEP